MKKIEFLGLLFVPFLVSGCGKQTDTMPLYETEETHTLSEEEEETEDTETEPLIINDYKIVINASKYAELEKTLAAIQENS